MNTASSPSSVARADAPRSSGSAGPRLDGPVPDVTLPLRFVLFGIFSLVSGIVMLVARPDLLAAYHYNQHIVAITHVFVLGFLLSIVSGAMYQLVPIVLETPLHSERLARWHFVVHVVSVTGMVAMFWVWNMKQLGHFGSGLALGAALFSWNIIRTLLRVRGWTVVSFGIASVLFWLGSVVIAGLALAAAKSTYELNESSGVNPVLAATLNGLRAAQSFLARFEPLAVMHSHAHLGVLGVFILVTCTIAYRLVPMFVIGEMQNPRRAWTSLWLINAGTAATFLAVLNQSPLKPVAGLISASGLLLYGLELHAIIRNRRRKTLDWGIRMFLTSQSLLGVLVLLGLGLSRPGIPLTPFSGQLETTYGFLAILGVAGLAILGMLYKIVPFLVWFAAYSRQIGRTRTPALHEMYSTRLQILGGGSWLAGLAVTIAGILASHPACIRAGTLLLAASLVTFAFNIARILGHLVHPQLQPIAPRVPASGGPLRTTT